ncbi:hypothetical protein ACH4T9_31850 [Micromonospora sp. NPDC020750]|uniref:hypothetical protein n=1 Tax=unclassified Micromonospora TaxID=2617518 RepID=UPI0037999E5A
MLPNGYDFAYLGDSACAGVGEVVVNVSGTVGPTHRGATDEIMWFGGGAMATHSAAPLLIDAALGAFEESLQLYWRADIHAAADVGRYITERTAGTYSYFNLVVYEPLRLAIEAGAAASGARSRKPRGEARARRRTAAADQRRRSTGTISKR